MKIYWLIPIIANLAQQVIKISIALFLIRLVQGTHFKRYMWGLVVFLTLHNLAIFGFGFGECWPIKAWWSFGQDNSDHCVGKQTTYIFDTYLTGTFPMPVLLHLKYFNWISKF